MRRTFAHRRRSLKQPHDREGCSRWNTLRSVSVLEAPESTDSHPNTQIHARALNRQQRKEESSSSGKPVWLARTGHMHRSLEAYFLVHRSYGPPKWPMVCPTRSKFRLCHSQRPSAASSYLHSLGLSKSAACLVLLAGPLSGLVVQPLAGAFADRTTSRYGRRKPFMLIGSLACAISILVLSWAQELSSVLSGVSPDVRSYFLVVNVSHRAKEERLSLLPYHSILLILP